MMGARDRIEAHSIFLQKFAYQLLTNDGVRLATIGKLVGDQGIFDRDMTTVLTLLFAHNNLSSPQIGNPSDQPVYILRQIAKDLMQRGFYLPSLRRRFNHIRETTNDTWRRDEPNAMGGGEAGALDKPLRSLRQKMYELRLHDDGRAEGAPAKARSGEETTQLVEKLITSVKSLETEGLPYRVKDSSERVTQRQTEFLNSRYDELAAKINTSTGTTAEGDKIPLLHLHPQHLRDDPNWSERWYAVKEEDFSRLVKAVSSAREGWAPEDQYKFVGDLVKDTEDGASDERKEQHQAELDALGGFTQPGSTDQPVIRVVRLPFTPDQIDDNFPTLELADDEAVGPNVTRVRIENINRMRFAGFVDFDNKYRMMIMWANSPSDKKKDPMGRTYKDLLVRVLGVFKNQYEDLLGMTPEVHKTKAGASYYFPKAISVASLVETFNELRNLINRTNSSIERYEVEQGLEREFNREINDDELPSHMEESA